jgi:hypothetical protein
LVAVFGDANAADQFHDEERPAGVSGAGVVNASDVRMVHHGEGLALGFEASDDGLCVHAQPDDFEGDTAAHGFLLFGHVNNTAAAFADLLQEFVPSNAIAGLFGEVWNEFGPAGANHWFSARDSADSRSFKEAGQLFLFGEERLDPCAQGVVAGTDVRDEGAAFGGRFVERGEENLALVHWRRGFEVVFQSSLLIMA